MVNRLKRKAGLAGAAATHKTRWEILKELSGIYGKDGQDRFLKWRTWQLKELIKWVRATGHKKWPV